MAISVLHLHPLLVSIDKRIKYKDVVSSSLSYFGRVECSSCRFYLRARLQQCVSGEGFVKLHCTSLRSKMLDDLNTNVDNLDDLERQLQELFVEIKTMLAMGNKNDAMCLLQANYEMAKEQVICGSKGIEQAALLDILALGYMGAGEVSKLERVLHMLKEVMSGLHDDMPLMDSILMHMGSIYANLGKFEDAMLVYERGLKILEKEFGKDSPFLITPLMGMAKVYRLLGRSTKSAALYHKSVDIVEKSRGADSEELVVPLVSLGNLFINEGKAVDAEACFRRILNIYKKAHGDNDGRVGMAMCSLAHALCAKGSVEEAISMYRGGILVIKDSEYVNIDDDILEKIKIDLAELLHVTGREQEGRELLQECLLITERYKGLEHPSAAAHLVNLAASYSRSKNFTEAERLLRTCLQIMSKSVGPTDQSITVPMLHLAVALYHLKKDEEAESFALEVARIRENAFGKESLPVAEALDCLASIQTRLGKDDANILAKLQRILSIQERELGYESEVTVETLKKVVFYLDKMGKKEEKSPLERRLRSLRAKNKQKVSA
ncbi:nephrocystin-3 isoform X1 [Asparagus officinalis]|uniref:nephrocystin-3 isoform X1 n=2 Tax=Asparagus officinalis TaxID=4686 RepID=UPI00098E2214|nr:nephrocystin-3 isoform X1 [Asparagus officinalis]